MQGPVRMRIEIGFEVIQKMQAEIKRNPHSEVGGKFVGFIHAPIAFCSDDQDWRARLAQLHIEVVDYIGSGPRATQSAHYLYPDGEYQERVFREIEAKAPDVAHIGTWHSHHCNGLGALSLGDIKTYHYYANHELHSLDFFLATLAIDSNIVSTARHFVFLRRHAAYYELTRDSISIVKRESPFRVILHTAGIPQFPDQNNAAKPPLANNGLLSEIGPKPIWYTTESGKTDLARIHRFLMDFLEDIRIVRHDNSIRFNGIKRIAGTPFIATYLIPSNYPDGGPVFVLTAADLGVINREDGLPITLDLSNIDRDRYEQEVESFVNSIERALGASQEAWKRSLSTQKVEGP
jgi:hypothetical protein